MKKSGIIKWFDESKGFGIIGTPTNEEYFLHKSNLISKPIELHPKTPVIFIPDFERDKKTAKECHLPENVDDLITVLMLIGKTQTVSIKTKIKGTSRLGNPYVRNEFKSFNVFEVSIKQIFNKKSKDELFDLIKNSYIKIKDTYDKFDYNIFFQIITKQINQLQIENAHQLIDKLYQFFGENLSEDILFSVWKNKNFHFIGKYDFEDYEISEKILLQNVSNITIENLSRIQKYESGNEICFNIVTAKIKDITNQTPSNLIKEAYNLLEYIKSLSKKEKLRSTLNNVLYERMLEEITVALNDLPKITDKIILSKYNKLEQLIPTEITESQKIKLSEIISKNIIDKSTEQVKIDLWLSDYISEIKNSQIVEFLYNENNELNDKLKVLSKIHISDNISFILEQLLEKQISEKIFELIEQFIKKENNLGYHFELKTVRNSKNFSDDKIGYKLLKKFKKIVTVKTSKEERANLFFKGWLDNYPSDYILYIVKELTEDKLIKVLNNKTTNEEYKFKLLEAKCKEISDDETNWFLQLCQKFLLDKDFEKIDRQIIKSLSNESWFELWKGKATKVLRKEYLIEYFNKNQSNYNEVFNWINYDIISEEKIGEILFEKLNLGKEITDRIEFYTAFNIIQKLIEIDLKWVDKILSLNNNFYNLLLWHIGYNDEFDFKTLKGKFIYFNPSDQVYIFKRLFYLKHIGKINFTFEELDEIVRADVDLFLINEKFNNDFVLDISTHIIIEAIKSSQSKNSFLFESDLILKDLQNNSSKKFKIENYFEECPGRLIADWNWNTNGKIEKIVFPNDNNRFYYAIKFEAAFLKEGENYYGSYTYFKKNPLFEILKEDVKKISGRKWNADKKYWRVPSSSKNEVFEFAKKHKFFIDLGDKKNYDNNTHLVEYKRDDIPNGIRFCEGRKSNKKHNTLKNEFWWCANQPCFQFAEIDYLSDDFLNKKEEDKKIWEYYKFIDILRILKINTDEHKEAPADFIPDGHYYKFIGHINAFNRLLDKLYCHKCKELLYPTETSHFALYRVTKFHCENENCSEYKKPIYLNHCLNGECNNIIDSRISKTCENGLYICNECGSCCSNSMFKRQLDKLKLVGGYIHPGLIKNIQEENGHLEKAEYYCYKCGGMMTEINKKKYKCYNCNVTYDLEKFKWLERKWVKKNQRRKDYPV